MAPHKKNEHGLGRIYRPDERDKNFPIRDLLRSVRKPQKRKTWPHGDPFLDQGQTSGCVGFSWAHYRNAGPVLAGRRLQNKDAEALYLRARQIDEYPGEADEGTSVRAGAQVLVEQGKITAYHWAQIFQDIVDALLKLGPVVMGTNWYDSMYDVDKKGYVQVNGNIAGGHAWLLVGVNVTGGYAIAKQSWGKHAMDSGMFKITLSDLERLFNEEGEACVAEGEVR